MKILRYIFIMILLVFYFISFGFSKELPSLYGAKISAKVEFNSTNELFTYSYYVTNDSKSKANINSFDIDISRPFGTERVERIDHLNNLEIVDMEDYNFKMSEIGFNIIPIAFLEAPNKLTGISLRNTAGFFVESIFPSQTLGNFVLSSKGLAGIRKFEVEHIFDCNKYFPSIDMVPFEEVQGILNALAELERQNRIEGKTLGPTALPMGVTLPGIVDFIINQKEEAFQLNWIDNEGVANSLNKKLENAKMKIEQALSTKSQGLKEMSETQMNAAKNILNALINELDAQKGKHVDDNAYYLLKVNVEYLLYKMK